MIELKTYELILYYVAAGCLGWLSRRIRKPYEILILVILGYGLGVITGISTVHY